MKKICSAGLLLLCSLISVINISCKKDYLSIGPSAVPTPIGDAEAYFSDHVEHIGSPDPNNYRASIRKTVLWDQAVVVNLSFGKAVIVPVKYADSLFIQSNFGGDRRVSLESQTNLFVYRDGKKVWHADLVTTFPDSGYLARPSAGFSGFRFVEDWQGNSVAKYLYNPGQIVKKYKQSNIQTVGMMETCNTIYGYNYSEDGEEYEWTESGGCTEMYIPDEPGAGQVSGGDYGGGGASGGSQTVVIMSPHNVITDIKSYFQCFTVNASSTYKVTICVNQPYPGTRETWAFSPYNSSSGYSNLFDPGHCFLIFSEQDGSTTIIRNVGFYPDGMVVPYYPSAQGVLNNDEQHEYNISGSFAVGSGSFFNMLAYVSKGNVSGYKYNLNTNNCTTFDINTLNAGGIYLPSTIGTWLHGSGNDPGDMGEDIRTMNISGMTRGLDEVAHPNIGSCN
jgi:hypothetical protein